MSEWQPIETAPKDGTSILVCGGKFYSDGGENGALTCPEDDLDEPRIARWVWDDWYLGYGEGYNEQYWAEPTHWMPLPAPPAKPVKTCPVCRGPAHPGSHCKALEASDNGPTHRHMSEHP